MLFRTVKSEGLNCSMVGDVGEGRVYRATLTLVWIILLTYEGVARAEQKMASDLSGCGTWKHRQRTTTDSVPARLPLAPRLW